MFHRFHNSGMDGARTKQRRLESQAAAIRLFIKQLNGISTGTPV
jgi:hypothetical protein